MRTPGNDFELAAGFRLSAKASCARATRSRSITYCLDPGGRPRSALQHRYRRAAPARAAGSRALRTALQRSAAPAASAAARSSIRCAISASRRSTTRVRVAAELLYALPERMREAQRIFESTGGLHAAALFDERGEPLAVREDVGRHNALDKIVGWGAARTEAAVRTRILMVSGRASYEILQKSVMARIPIVARFRLRAAWPSTSPASSTSRSPGFCATTAPTSTAPRSASHLSDQDFPRGGGPPSLDGMSPSAGFFFREVVIGAPRLCRRRDRRPRREPRSYCLFRRNRVRDR